MGIRSVYTMFALCIVALFVSGCPGSRTNGLPTFELSDLSIKVPDPPATMKCDPAERPDDIGCTTICKPCKTSFCVDGQWVPEDIDTSELCQRPGTGIPPSCCPRGPGFFCPAECSCCI